MLFRLPVLIFLGLAACAQPPATVPIRAERQLVPGPPIEPGQEAQVLAVLPMQFGSFTRSAEPEVIGADRALIRYSSSGASTRLSATVFLIGLGDNPPGDGPDSHRALQELERGANDALAQLRATLNPEKEGGAFNPTIQRSQGPAMRCRGRVLPLATDTATDVLCSTLWRQRLLQIRLTQRHPHEALLAAALVNNGFMYIMFERLHGEAPGALRT
jgi:hypothetical protein